MKSLKSQSFFVVLALAFAFVTVGPVAGVQAGGAETKLEGELVAGPVAGDVSGKAKFEDRDGRRKFSAEIEGLNTGDMFDVMVAGQVVGTVTIDAAGVGDLNLDDNFEPGVDDPATRFPANFPMLDGGEMVTVGQLSGTLQSK